MGRSIRIGRVLGIELRIDTSWLFILMLLLMTLPRVFFGWHPEWAPLTVLLVAIMAALMFFASILLHELAHSVVARAYGLPVRDITLHMFGGISNIEREPPTPGAELVIAIVGPLASIGLGLAMTVIVAAPIALLGVRTGEINDTETAQRVVAQLGPVSTLLLWLGPINVVIGLFNLIPGFPLDGGRVLRAIAWKITGDVHRATRAAALAGQGVGWGFVVIGVFMAFGYHVPLFGTGLGSGLWLGLIGLFLRNMAVAHYTGTAIAEALAGMRVRDLMRTRGPWIGADTSVKELVNEWFLVRGEHALPVFDGGRFVGIVSLDDVRRIPPSKSRAEELVARDIMTLRERLVTVSPEEDVEGATRRLATLEVHQLPVVADDALVGMLFESDVMRWLQLANIRRNGRHREASATA